jgi:hypothetical protein
LSQLNLLDPPAAAVNDPPSFTPGPSSVTVTEDSAAYSAQWASAVSAGPAETDALLSFTVSCSSSATFTMFTAAPQVNVVGILSFTPAPNAYGSSVCNVTLVDGGGLRSASQQLAIVITPGELWALLFYLITCMLNSLNDQERDNAVYAARQVSLLSTISHLLMATCTAAFLFACLLFICLQ